MSTVKNLENKLEGLFKNVPSLPASSKEGLAKALPWIALIFGILQLFAGWALWNLIRTTEEVISQYNAYYVNYPDAMSGFDRLIIYLGIIVLIVDAVILLMAYPELKKRSRRGWDLLFLGALINLAYAITSLFISDRGFGSFFFSLLGSAIGFYLLFQVRGKYSAGSSQKKERKASYAI